MATTTYHEYTGNASTTEFVYSFEPIKIEDVKVALNGVTQTTGYTATLSPAKVTFTSAPASGVVVRVYRDTDVDSPKAVYAAGSSIRALDLNNNHDQVLYALQEEQNQKGIFEEIKLDDDVKIKLGNSDDFTIEWDSSASDALLTVAGDYTVDATGGYRFKVGGSQKLFLNNGEFISYQTFKPNADDSIDLGTSSAQWRNLYVDGTGYIDTISADTATINGNLVVTGNISDSTGSLSIDDNVTLTGHVYLTDDKKVYLGNTTDASIYWTGNKLELASSGDIELYGSTINIDGPFRVRPNNVSTRFMVDDTEARTLVDFKPYSNNSYDLGKADKQWKNLYVDGTGYIDTVSADDITGSAIVTSGTSTSDTKVYSAKRCDELYYNLASAEEIQSGETWVAADNKLATTAAIDARIVDLVDDVGGFVPIANETSFPNANPDVNNGAGTLVSVPLANNLTSNGSGVISISNGTVGNSTVTINGAANNTTYTQGFGIIVETTTTLNTYTLHRYVPKATEVTAVAGSIANVNTVAGNNSNITTVAGISGNVTTVAGVSANVTTVAGVAANVTTVAGVSTHVPTVAGIASNVTTVAGISSDVTAVAGDAADIGACSTNIGSIAAIGSDLAGNFENITDHGSITGAVTSTSGTSDITTVANSIANVNIVSPIAANVTTVAGISANVTSVAGNATNINTCATNISAITGASTQATNAATSATNAASSATTASTQATNASTSATSAASSATTATSQASTATTQASNASTSAANALAYKNLALTYRNEASAILTQVESAPYNLSDSASTHTAWGNITDTGANAVFTNESSNTLLTMAEGSSSYNYGSIT